MELRDKENEGQEHAGSFIFFDAFPVQSPTGKLKADIMNAHYQPYYGDTKGETPPGDYHKLNPITFLTVENLGFQFMVGLRNDRDDFEIQIGHYQGRASDVVITILKDALTSHGIGAKTAVGYGYMKPTNG